MILQYEEAVTSDTLTNQIITFIVVTVILLIPIIFYRKANEWHTKRTFIIKIIAAVFLVYFLAARYGFDLYNFFDNFGKWSSLDEYWYSITLSKALLLDMCPLMAFLLPLTIIFGKNLRKAKILAPMAIVGAVITLYGQAIWMSNYDAADFFEYIFVGFVPNRLYFMMHFMSLFLGVLTLVLAPPFTKKNYIWIFGWLCFWLAYELIMIAVLGIEYNATGLVPNDWFIGQYYNVYKLIPMSFPLIVIVWYIVAVLVNYILVLIFPKNTRIFRENAKSNDVSVEKYL